MMKRTAKAVHLLLAFFLSLFAWTSVAQATKVTFDGIVADVDLGGVTIGGVKFSYDSVGENAVAFIDEIGLDPEGGYALFGETVGMLTLDFAVPVTALGYDYWLFADADVIEGVIAESTTRRSEISSTP